MSKTIDIEKYMEKENPALTLRPYKKDEILLSISNYGDIFIQNNLTNHDLTRLLNQMCNQFYIQWHKRIIEKINE